jgi:hypothetical protein
MRRLALLFVALLVVIPAAAFAAPNIYPDPSFENSGVPGVARTGEKAGYLKVDAKNHWAAIGGPLTVEPFARYRVTEWVKGRIGPGTFFAPYCYEWNNYEWAYSNSHAIQSSADWVQTEMTFVSPYDHIQLHPLAYIDCENSEAWVDDIVVEKVAEPAQVIAEIEANANRSRDDLQILARWYVKQGRMDDTAALLKTTNDRLTLADISCLIALNTKDTAKRRPFIVSMLVNGGPTYNDGMKRFGEATEGLTDDQKLQVCEDALKTSPDVPAIRAYVAVLEGYSAAVGGAMPVADATAKLADLQASIARMKTLPVAGEPAEKEMQLAMSTVDDAAAKLADRKASLGHCKVIIGDKTLSPDTYVIAIPDRATLQETHAAQDLAYHIELVTGESLKVVPEKQIGGLTPILVGNCRQTHKLDRQLDLQGLGLEGIRIRTVGPALILAGNQRGVLYATYTFLEDYLGCRWFTPDCSTWPKTGTIHVPEIDRRYIPPLEYRGTDYPCALPGDYSVRNRYNGGNHQPDEARGGHVGVHSLAHTFNYLVPPSKYFATHPEYYSEINGKRLGPNDTQLCLTNPDVVKIATETIRQWIKDNPDKTIFSVSQNDYWNYCTCPKCKAVADEEGSQSGVVVRFINQIADAIKDEYPNVAIETLAYQYTRKPPKLVKPRPNVIICLCSIECCFAHPLATDPFNKTFVDDIEGWHKICNRLYIWDYVINYAHSICPFPNLYVLKPNTQFFIKNGVKGIYEESCYFTKGSEMQELRAYIMAKTLWDPNYDTDKAINEFCAAFYGPAAKYVRDYITLIHHDTQANPKLHVQIYTHPRNYITHDMIVKANALFDKAEAAAANDPTFLHRVQVARLPIMYAEITLADSGTFQQRDDKLVQTSGHDVGDIVDRFTKIARAEGVTMISEGQSFDAWLAAVPRRAHEVKIEKLSNPALELSVLPDLGGRIWRAKYLAKGLDIVKMAGAEGAFDPSADGYEEYSESGYRSPGWIEPFEVKEKSDRAITLEATLHNGLRLTRHIELDPEKPIVNITSTVTNPGGETKTACLRIHPEFAVKSTQKASVRMMKADGTWAERSLANPKDPNAEDQMWLQGGDVPNGAWAVVDEANGISIINRVPREQIGQCLLNWNGAGARVNLEVYSPEKNLGPGQSITISQSYEVTGASGK